MTPSDSHKTQFQMFTVRSKTVLNKVNGIIIDLFVHELSFVLLPSGSSVD